jgi:chemotaxis protein CheD
MRGETDCRRGAQVKHIVGVADMCVSSTPGDVIVTYALGSCLGLTVHDPVAAVGGMLHVMLPLSTIDANRARDNPCMFVDTGVPRLFLECYKAGAEKRRLQVKVAGGAWVHQGDESGDFFQIGKRNVLVLRKLLWRNGVLLEAEDVEGTCSRMMSLEIGSGQVLIRSEGQQRPL